MFLTRFLTIWRNLRTSGLAAVIVQEKADAELAGAYRELGNLTAELSLSEERERRRIALTLHDTVVQNLALGKLKLDAALNSGQIAVHPVLRELQQLLDTSMHNLRDLSSELSPPILYDLGLGPAFVSLGEKTASKFGFRFIYHQTPDRKDLCENLKISIYQFFRELLMNIVKHAGAGTVTVLLNHKDDKIILSIDDDGKGFDMTGYNEGFGLANIRQRVHYLRGELKIRSMPEVGTRIVIAIDQGKSCYLTRNGEPCMPCQRYPGSHGTPPGKTV